MRKIALTIALYATIFAQGISYAAAPSRAYNYASGTTIASAQVNANETTIYTYLQNGIEVIASGVVTDANIVAGAGIQYSKLNLAGQIVNADINASAAIADSKLAQITTASKVSTSSLTGNFTTDSFNGGTGASSSTFWRGDATWSAVTTIPSGVIVMWSGSIATIPSGWVLCNGSNSTPDLRNRFIVAADADVGGVAKTTVTGSATVSGNGSIPAHTHSQDGSTVLTGAGSVYNNNAVSGTTGGTTGSFGTGVTNIAVYYALAYIMKS